VELSQEVKVVKGLPTEWGKCSHTVCLNPFLKGLACWKDLIAVGLASGDISILNAITGISVSVLSGHTGDVDPLIFSLDGTLLVSGSWDNTIKLWDVQTGGVVNTFQGHTDWIFSVSISLDHTMIGSGSNDATIRLWDTLTGDCCCIIDMEGAINSLSFSPTDPQLLISASRDNTIQWWCIDGYQIGPTYEGDYVALSSDGTCFISWGESGAKVHSCDSGVVIAELQVPDHCFDCCCFSPDNKVVAGSAGCTIYLWDITKPVPYLIETLVGHTSNIKSLAFSSSLISVSQEGLIKFWQVGALSGDSVATKSLPLTQAPVMSVTLQGGDGIAISSDTAGVVRIWDIITGHCKASISAPIQNIGRRDMRLIDDRLILVGEVDDKIYIWDAKQKEPLLTVNVPPNLVKLRIAGDGSKVFFRRFNNLEAWSRIQAWSIWTGEVLGEVECPARPRYNSLIVDGPRVGILFEDSKTQWWDFGITGSTPNILPDTFMDQLHLEFVSSVRDWDIGPSSIVDRVTRREVLRLSGRNLKPHDAQWDGQYLVAGYQSGEVLILDFNHLQPQ